MNPSTTATWLWIGSTLWGAAAAWLGVCVVGAVAGALAAQNGLAPFEQERRRRLRLADKNYAQFEPILIPLAEWNSGRWGKLSDWIRRTLVSAGEADWTADEFLALKQIEACFVAAVGCVAVGWWQDSLAWACLGAAGGFAIGLGSGLSGLKAKAEKRRGAIAVRLPYAVDLVALILEAGGHFLDALSTLVQEMEHHPLADELAHVHRAIRLGLPREEALKALADRVGLPALAELVATIIQGEAGGTPIAEIFRVQAEQMRIKRSQAIEKATAQANVHMVYPGLISMLACILVMGCQFVIWMMAANG